MKLGQFQLLGTRRFGPLFVTQALGAFNDNAFKAAITILITYELAQRSGDDPALLIAIAAGLFILPFLLFSALAGQLADAHDKAAIARFVKLAEIVIMVLAALTLHGDSAWAQIFVLFLLGTHSAFFGPVKYGILPQLLKREELLAGNGLIEMGTFIAILLGTMFGGILVIVENGRTLVGASTIALAGCGYLASRFIPSAPPVARLPVDFNLLRATGRVLSAISPRRHLLRAIIGISWFWFLGTVFLTELPALTRDTLHGNEAVANFFIAAFTIGIAAGSLGANRLLRGEISLKYVPATVLLLTLLILELHFAVTTAEAEGTPELMGIGAFLSRAAGWRVLIDLAIISFIAGIYVVPLYAFVQARSPISERARIIAANNIVNAGFMVAAAGLAAAGLAAGLTVPHLFLALALMNAAAAVYALVLLPQELLKQLGRALFRLAYRVEVKGLEHYRAAGRRVIVAANHQSHLDGALIGAFLPDRPHFAVPQAAAGRWWAKLAGLLFDLIPLDPANPMAARALVQVLKRGGKLVIFPEGRVSVTGALMKVYETPAAIAHISGAKIVPLRIDGAQYSLLSKMRGKLRLRPFPRIALTFLPAIGVAVPEGVKGGELRDFLARSLYDAMSDMVFRTGPIDRHIVQSLIDAAAINGRSRRIVEDVQRAPLTYGRLMMASFILGRRLAHLVPNETSIAVLLPTAAGCLATLFGISAFGRVPAMLNYSTGAVNMAAACVAAQARTVVTSRRFIEQGGFEADLAVLERQARVIYLEDVREGLSLRDKLYGLWARTFPSLALKAAGARLDPAGPAVILFTSGSEGVPKGVVLSHRNLNANRTQVAARIDFSGDDIVFNALPMFHAFGLTVGTLLPVLSGVRTFLYPSPLHYKIVPELCYDTNATILLSTDTFLSGYARNADPYDFFSVRYVVAGAEPVKPETRELWMEKFGLRIIEGYGCTECSPVIAANTPMYFRSGTVGRIFDGIEHRLEPVEGIETGGRLIVRGPNVMLGYLRADEPGALEPPPGGWHDTGDIASIDAEGFLKIVGRLKRFAKIGGEMVPLGAVESHVAAAYPTSRHAVVAVPDRRKGEQLVLVSTEPGLDRNHLLFSLRTAGVAELMIPRQVIDVEEMPVLGSGKTDYVTIRKIARERVGA